MLSLLNPSASPARPAIAADPLGGGLRADGPGDSDGAGPGGFAGALQRSADALQDDAAAAAPGLAVARRAVAAADARRAAAGRAPAQDVEPPPVDDDGTEPTLAGDCGLADPAEPGLSDTLPATALPAPLPAIDPDISRAAGLLPAPATPIATDAPDGDPATATLPPAGAVPASPTSARAGAPAPAVATAPPVATAPAVAARAAERIAAAARPLPDAATPKALPAPIDPLPGAPAHDAASAEPAAPVAVRPSTTAEPTAPAPTDLSTQTVEPRAATAAVAAGADPAPTALPPGAEAASAAQAPVPAVLAAPVPATPPAATAPTSAAEAAPSTAALAATSPPARPLPAGIGAVRAAEPSAAAPGGATTRPGRSADDRAGEPAATRGPSRASRTDAATERFTADATGRNPGDVAPLAGRGAAQDGRDGAGGSDRFAAAASTPAAGPAPAASPAALPRFADQLQSLLAPAPATPASPAPSFADAPTYTLPTSPQSPEFAPAMGAQISLMAKEGVQQARIELNPLDLGPVLVQISLDGNAARVDFHAEVASTRQAIESSLPTLAGSLRDAGMTLAGGGVFQQPQQQSSPGRHGDDGHRRGSGPRGRDDDASAGPAGVSTVSAAPRRGLVDLVA
ncbi:flagellar hook-length control protein FliK [Aquabacterium humicola]|uniref:flagellar hook-length control protein FliK n=1 Tax=Aquabacterium humicola TaxID=3237377 RepID=UPI0025431CF8|nr:flagellar hook-length control protein FliK [Rubrivivax pictus]